MNQTTFNFQAPSGGTGYDAAVTAFSDRLRAAILETLRIGATAIHGNIVRATPIDTGRAKSSWNMVQGESADLSVTPPLKDTGAHIAAPGASPLTTAQAHTAAFATRQNLDKMNTPVVTISNDLYYIGLLENGSSPQAAPGTMFHANALEGRQILEEAAENAAGRL